MTRSDKERVMSILQQSDMFTAGELTVAEEQIDIFLDRPRQQDYRQVVVEDDTGRVAGWMSYGPAPMTEGTFDLYWIVVAPEEQGRGYGKTLVRWLEDQVRRGEGRLLLIETASQPKYEPTRHFYIGLGYTEVARIADFYKPGDDRVTYAKYFLGKGV